MAAIAAAIFGSVFTVIWYADYPSASDFFDLFFRCSAFRLDDSAVTRNGAFYCNPAADQLMNQADSQQASDPPQAAATWAAVDRAVTSDAPWVTLANLNNVDFLSTRVTNYQYNPFLGVLLDQLRIRPAPSRADGTHASTIQLATGATSAPNPAPPLGADSQAALNRGLR
jgi:hypothetical protein